MIALVMILLLLASATFSAVRNAKGPTYALVNAVISACLLYTSPSPRDRQKSRMPSSA